MMVLLLAAGCSDSPDERLAELAEQSLRQQASQNERLAEQSKQIAEASRHLVKNDSEARKEMIAAHATLQKELQAERANINQQLSNIEDERRDIAQQRGRDPIIAQTIGAVGLTLGCLLPLLLAGYIIHTFNRTNDDNVQTMFTLSSVFAASWFSSGCNWIHFVCTACCRRSEITWIHLPIT